MYATSATCCLHMNRHWLKLWCPCWGCFVRHQDWHWIDIFALCFWLIEFRLGTLLKFEALSLQYDFNNWWQTTFARCWCLPSTRIWEEKHTATQTHWGIKGIARCAPFTGSCKSKLRRQGALLPSGRGHMLATQQEQEGPRQCTEEIKEVSIGDNRAVGTLNTCF